MLYPQPLYIDKPDGPGKWLLHYCIQPIFDSNPLNVRFKTGYEAGRHHGRTARTLKSWFVTEPPLRDEVALKWTDNRAQVIIANVPVQYLLPGLPLLNHRVVVIEGANIGQIGNVEKKNRKTKHFVVRLEYSDIYLELPESSLCRLADPE